jgi:hypothetical protein
VWFMNGSDCRFPRKDVPLHVCDTIIESYSAKGVSGSIHGLGFVALFDFRLPLSALWWWNLVWFVGRWPVTVPDWVQGLGFGALCDFLFHGARLWWWRD